MDTPLTSFTSGPSLARIGAFAFVTTTITCLPPARMLAQLRLPFLFRGLLAYKRSHAALFACLERSLPRIGACAAGGVGRKCDRDAFEAFEEELNGGS